VDSALVETIFIVGPALVALFVAAGYPFGAVLFAAVCAGVGSIIFLRTPAVENWAIPADSEPRRLLGPLRVPGLLAVFAATVLYAVAFGLYEVAVTAFATNRGSPAAGGVILMLAESFTWSATCLLGGISAGIAAGGVLAEHVSPALILAAAAASTLLSGGIVWTTLGDQR
jgi:hypothetical protein